MLRFLFPLRYLIPFTFLLFGLQSTNELFAREEGLEEINAKLQALENPRDPSNDNQAFVEKLVSQQLLICEEKDCRAIYDESQLFVDMPYETFRKRLYGSYLAVLAKQDKSAFILNGSKFRVVRVLGDLNEDPKFAKAVAFFQTKNDVSSLRGVRVLLVDPPAPAAGIPFFEEAHYYWIHDDSIEAHAIFSVGEKQGPKIVGNLHINGLSELRRDHVVKVFGSADVILMSRAVYEDDTPTGVDWRNGTLIRALSLYRRSAEPRRAKDKGEFRIDDEIREELKQEILKKGWETYKANPDFQAGIKKAVAQTKMDEGRLKELLDTAYAEAVTRNIATTFEGPHWLARRDEAAYYRQQGYDRNQYFKTIDAHLGWIQPPNAELRINNPIDNDGGGLSSTSLGAPLPYLTGDAAWFAYDSIVKAGDR